eukprot:1067413-Heterocapsa_arctica.AAC.1
MDLVITVMSNIHHIRDAIVLMMIVNDEAQGMEEQTRLMEEQIHNLEQLKRTIGSMQHTIDRMQSAVHQQLSTETRLRLLINTYNGFTRTEFESYIVNDLHIANYYDSDEYGVEGPDKMWDRFQTMCDEEELQRDINRAEFE